MIHLRRISAICCLLATLCVTHAAETITAQQRAQWQAMAQCGPGFLVWESNRTGRWRIWTRQLDGSGLRQLTPTEAGRDHFCPHLSPDGTRLLYLSFAQGDTAYQPFPKRARVPLHLINSDGTGDRVVVADARAFGEDRAVVWTSNSRFLYIGGDGKTYAFDLATKGRTLCVEAPVTGYGWLLDAQERYAIAGFPAEFAGYDPDLRTVIRRAPERGCQPYFTHDGRWGFWMGGTGGPINRFELATRTVSPILAKDDPRLPAGRRYVYFPMISRCGRLLGFAASPGQHDHFTTDYDLFLARLNPETLEIIGTPVRYTSDPACDRFPDIFLGTYALGSQLGEAPYTARFTAPGTGWRWTCRSGAGAGAITNPHTFTQPGTYLVRARKGTQLLEGSVQVLPARPPRVLAVQYVGPTALRVTFDEPITAPHPQATLASGVPITETRVTEDGRGVLLTCDGVPSRPDRLTLAGITDRAQRPNALPAQTLAVVAPAWPADARALLLCWATGAQEQRAVNTCALRPQGFARYDRHFALLPAGGAFAVVDPANALAALRTEDTAYTLEMTVRTPRELSEKPAYLFRWNAGEQDELALEMTRERLTLRVGGQQRALGTLPSDTTVHLLLTLAPDGILLYRDGAEALRQPGLTVACAPPQSLLLGEGFTGTLEGIALYQRALTADEARQHAERYALLRQARPAVPVLDIEARLRTASRPPTLQEILPYRQALVVDEYAVERVHGGAYTPTTIRLVRWALLDGQPTPPLGAPEAPLRLSVEPYADHPELTGDYLADTLPEQPEAALYVITAVRAP